MCAHVTGLAFGWVVLAFFIVFTVVAYLYRVGVCSSKYQ